MSKSRSRPQKDVPVTVVIPNWNGKKWLTPCIEALDRQTYREFKIIVVDNGSVDGSADNIQSGSIPVHVEKLNENTGFANAANVGIERSDTPYVALLNSDTEVFPDWLSSLVKRMDSCGPEVGAINSLMIQMDNPSLVDDAGDSLSWYGIATKNGHGEPVEDFQHEMEIFSPCAGAALYRRDFLNSVGGFDIRFFAYLEDVDLGLRGRLLGYKYLFSPAARVLHKSHGSGIKSELYVELTVRNRLYIFLKCIPARLLLLHAPKLLYGQVYMFLHLRHPLSIIKGFLGFILELHPLLKDRRKIQKEMTISISDANQLLTMEKAYPTMWKLLSEGFKRRLSRQN